MVELGVHNVLSGYVSVDQFNNRVSITSVMHSVIIKLSECYGQHQFKIFHNIILVNVWMPLDVSRIVQLFS